MGGRSRYHVLRLGKEGRKAGEWGQWERLEDGGGRNWRGRKEKVEDGVWADASRKRLGVRTAGA